MSDHIPIADQPAFPFACQGPTTAPEFYYGISIRDYFAAQALVAIRFHEDCWNQSGGLCTRSVKATAQASYEVADAMLAERNKQP